MANILRTFFSSCITYQLFAALRPLSSILIMVNHTIAAISVPQQINSTFSASTATQQALRDRVRSNCVTFRDRIGPKCLDADMELRRVWKHRHIQLKHGNSYVQLFWRSFAIISRWSRTVGLGRVLYFVLKVFLWSSALPVALCVISGAYLVQWYSDRYTTRKCRVSKADSWLAGLVVTTIMDQNTLLTHIKTHVASCSQVNPVYHLYKQTETSPPVVDNSKLLSRYVTRQASVSDPSDFDVKVIRMSRPKPPLEVNKFFVFIKTNSIDNFRRTLECFQLRIKNYKVNHDTDNYEIENLLLSSKVLFFLYNLVSVVITVKEIAQRVANKRPKLPLFRRYQKANVPGSIAWSETLPVELLTKLEDKTACDVDSITLTIVTSALRSYCQIMTGQVPDDVSALLLNSRLPTEYTQGARLKLPLNAHDTETALHKSQARVVAAKRQMLVNERMWNDYAYVLPDNLLRLLKRAYYGRNAVILQNIYLSDSDHIGGANFGTSVSSVYRWLPLLGRANLTITITHLPGGVSFSVMTDKKSMQSATLLAECVDKAVSNMCIATGVYWNRRSPPSTPFSCNNLGY